MNETFTGQNLIFVISQPRSGSTLLQRILAGHPDIQTSAETWLMLYPAYAMKNSGLEAEFNSKWANRGIQDFLENYADGNETYINAWRNWARVIYGKALEKSEKKYFLDKTPRYFFIIPELYQLFPDAKFIFLIRNPLAVLASELKTYVKGDWNILSLFYPDLIQAPNLILHGIDQLQEHAITIHYEDIVQYPEKAINQLCEKLGISFVENMLNYGDTPPPVGIMNDKVGIIRYDRPNTSSLNNLKKLTHDGQPRHFAQQYLILFYLLLIEVYFVFEKWLQYL